MLDVGQSDIVHAIQVLSAALQSGRLTLDGATMPVLLSIGAKPAKGQPEASAKAANARRQAEFRARRKALRVTESNVTQTVTSNAEVTPKPLRNVTQAVTGSNVTSNAQVTLLIDETTGKQAFREPLRNVTPSVTRVTDLLLISDLKEENKNNTNARGVTAVTESNVTEKALRKTEKAQRTSAAPSEEAEAAWLAALGIKGDPHDISHWLDHHRAKGSRFVSWAASWRTWVRNGIQFGTILPPVQPAPKPKPRDPDTATFDCSDLLAQLVAKPEPAHKTPLQQMQEALNAL